MNANLVFCGRLGSGKTRLSRGVASALEARWNGFGSTIKGIAAERGIPQTREGLQTLGAELVVNDPEALCRRVMRDAVPAVEQGIVIDGLRHESIYAVLRALSEPRRLWCIYVDVSDEVRFDRLRQRDHLTAEAIRELEAHSTEAQVPEGLRQLADYVADNNGDPENAIQHILKWIRTAENGLPNC